ncbi:hypothetical protein EON63_23295 [archaeon]|nr:MAG: hypothetical protein EON63_23295 [archaeon]
MEVTVDVDGSISASAAHRYVYVCMYLYVSYSSAYMLCVFCSIAELTRQELLSKHAGRVANR